ncbi:kinase-like protein [Penicillium sp. DV-2018c]|nr:kinase-like protein [Penicillium sp. DV-2018c]KAJ5567848.1 kinase-like protein [Penicillium sp. DV-2018c]
MTEPRSTEVPYEQQNLHKGHQYIKDGNTLLPCQSPVNPLGLEAGQEVVTVLEKQMGRLVLEWDFSWVIKSGLGVRSAEAEAMRPVFKHTVVPVPEVLFTDFGPDEVITSQSDFFKPDFHPPEGLIGMTIIPGVPLEQKWDTLDDEAKESVCLQLWDLIPTIQNIPRPPEFEGPYQCAADGSPSRDPLLEDPTKARSATLERFRATC